MSLHDHDGPILEPVRLDPDHWNIRSMKLIVPTDPPDAERFDDWDTPGLWMEFEDSCPFRKAIWVRKTEEGLSLTGLSEATGNWNSPMWWWGLLCSGSTGVVSPPHRVGWDSYATFLGITESEVCEMLAEEFFGVRVHQTPTSTPMPATDIEAILARSKAADLTREWPKPAYRPLRDAIVAILAKNAWDYAGFSEECLGMISVSEIRQLVEQDPAKLIQPFNPIRDGRGGFLAAALGITEGNLVDIANREFDQISSERPLSARLAAENETRRHHCSTFDGPEIDHLLHRIAHRLPDRVPDLRSTCTITVRRTDDGEWLVMTDLVGPPVAEMRSSVTTGY